MRSVVVAVLLLASAALCGCGGGGLDEDQFVEDLTSYSVPEEQARCVYAAIVDDEEVIDDIAENGVGDDVSSATADRLEAVLTRCLRDSNGGSDPDSDAAPSTTEDP